MRRVFTAKSCILAAFFDGFHAAPCPELSRPPVDSGPCHDRICSVRCRLPRAFSLHSTKDRSGSTRGMGTDFKVCIERQFGGIEGPVLNKIATSHRVCRGIVPAEAFDECKDVIGGLPPSERFGIGVVSINKRSDVCPESGDAAPRLIFLSVRRAKKRSAWLSHANWSGQVHVPARPFSHPSSDQCGRGVIVHDEMDVEFGRHSGLDLVEELTEFGSTVTSLALADGSSGRNVESGEQRCGAMSSVVMLRFGPAGRDASAAWWLRSSARIGTSHPRIERHRAPAGRCKGPRRRALWP